jgi:hypothetical protein
VHEGYGFRPPSGVSTPLLQGATPSPIPDIHGLGWPGEFNVCTYIVEGKYNFIPQQSPPFHG